MTTLGRWARFNAVGLLGAVVQLSTLALLNRRFPRHALYTSSAAVELTLLHNFLWHIHYTWRDRRDSTSRLHQCLRFHLSNGLVSLVGNLALMRCLTRATHLPLPVDNGTSILCCSVVNFSLGNRWAFPESSGTRSIPHGATARPPMRC